MVKIWNFKALEIFKMVWKPNMFNQANNQEILKTRTTVANHANFFHANFCHLGTLIKVFLAHQNEMLIIAEIKIWKILISTVFQSSHF